MKIAILSDIHGNLAAFEAAITDAKKKGCEKLLCLGDLTGYGDESAACIKLARKTFKICLMGNHDQACAGLMDEFLVRHIRNYDKDVEARETIPTSDMTWLKERPYVKIFKSYALTHGSFEAPRDWNYIEYPANAWRSLVAVDSQVLFVGHTHMPVIMQMSAEDAQKTKSFNEKVALDGFRGLKAVKSKSVALKPGARYVVNVGSVGLPRSGSKRIYAILDEGKRVSIERF